MALRQGKYSALGKALGQYRTSLYDVMEKEHEKEFIAWQGEKDRAMISGIGGAVAQGLDMFEKLKAKKARAEETKAYLIAEGGADTVERETKHGGMLGKLQAGFEDVFGGEGKYKVSGGDLGAEEDKTYGMGELRGMSQFHAVESIMNPEKAAKEKDRILKRKGDKMMAEFGGDIYKQGLEQNPSIGKEWETFDEEEEALAQASNSPYMTGIQSMGSVSSSGSNPFNIKQQPFEDIYAYDPYSTRGVAK